VAGSDVQSKPQLEFVVPTSSEKIPVSLLTGFLGSGKTTLLNQLIRDPAMARTLVIINEFGEIGLDHALLVHTTEEIVVEMSSGCLCCTIRGDLSKTLRDAPWRFAREGKRWFDRVIIETTGLADPVPVLHTLMMDTKVEAMYALDGVITTVDAATARSTLDRQFEAVKQIAVSDRIVLTKADLVSPDDIVLLESRIRELNPSAPIFYAANGVTDAKELFGAGLYNPATKSLDVQRWLQADAYRDDHSHHHHRHDVNRHDRSISAVCVAIDDPIRPDVFNLWMDLIAAYRGPDLLRIKGIVNMIGENGPVIIHGVQHIFHPSVTLEVWPDDDRRSRIVFIGRNLPAAQLHEAFRILSASAPPPKSRQAPSNESVGHDKSA
jgi:G3E family GTPase